MKTSYVYEMLDTIIERGIPNIKNRQVRTMSLSCLDFFLLLSRIYELEKNYEKARIALYEIMRYKIFSNCNIVEIRTSGLVTIFCGIAHVFSPSCILCLSRVFMLSI